jgi:hypothetical protein
MKWSAIKRWLADNRFALRAPKPVGYESPEWLTRYIRRKMPCCGRQSTHDARTVWVRGSPGFCAACGAIFVAEADYELRLATEEEQRAVLATPFGAHIRSQREIIEAIAEMESRRKMGTSKESAGA